MSFKWQLNGSGAADSDLTPATTINEKARGTQDNSNSFNTVVASGTDVIHASWSTEPTNPNILDWPNGTYSCGIEVLTIGSLVSFKFQLVRVNSSGTVQETLGTSSAVSTTGDHDFSVLVNPSSGAQTDRLQMRLLTTLGAGKGTTDLRLAVSDTAAAFLSSPMTTNYWIGEGVTQAFSEDLNWAAEQAPGTNDDIIFDGTTGAQPDKNCTFDSTTGFNSLDMQTGYTGTITQSVAVDVDDFKFNGGTYDADTFGVTCKTIDATGSTTRTVRMGSGTWNLLGSSIDLSGSNLTWSPETSTLNIKSSPTITSNGKSFHDVDIAGGTTVTLADNWNIDRDLTTNTTAGSVTINGNSIILLRNLARSTNASTDGTTKIIFSKATGSQDWSMTGDAKFSLDIEFALTGIASFTTTGDLYTDGDITFISLGTGGASIGAGTWTISGTCSIDTDGNSIQWDDIDMNTAGTVTLTGDLYVLGSLTLSDSVTLDADSFTIQLENADIIKGAGQTFTHGTGVVDFNGTCSITGSWDFNRLVLNPAGIITVDNTATLTCDDFSAIGNFASQITFQSDLGGTQFDFDLTPGSPQSVQYVVATDVDSSGGDQIFNINGTLSNTVNWVTAYAWGSLLGNKFIPRFGRGFLNGSK